MTVDNFKTVDKIVKLTEPLKDIKVLPKNGLSLYAFMNRY
jgi:hypothetical protein